MEKSLLVSFLSWLPEQFHPLPSYVYQLVHSTFSDLIGKYQSIYISVTTPNIYVVPAVHENPAPELPKPRSAG